MSHLVYNLSDNIVLFIESKFLVLYGSSCPSSEVHTFIHNMYGPLCMHMLRAGGNSVRYRGSWRFTDGIKWPSETTDSLTDWLTTFDMHAVLHKTRIHWPTGRFQVRSRGCCCCFCWPPTPLITILIMTKFVCGCSISSHRQSLDEEDLSKLTPLNA